MDLNKQGNVLILKLDGFGRDDMKIQGVAYCKDKQSRVWSRKLVANLYLEDYILWLLHNGWNLLQVDLKNVFLAEDLVEGTIH